MWVIIMSRNQYLRPVFTNHANECRARGFVWPNETSRAALVRVIRKYRPKVLITTHDDDPHPDHASTSVIVRQAARLATMVRYDEEAGLAAVSMPAIMHSLFSRRIV